nr:MAG TPA: hypothetical protein [Caudoviricetes sp.]
MKDFKGLVKISDVQNAFDEIVESINNMIDAYNASAKVLDIDYTKGSAELGASGYTLSVGGLKRVIQTYQGCSVGCKAFKIDDNHCKVTAGFVFADNTVYRANEQDMTGSGNILYFDVDNKRYSFGTGATSSIQDIVIPKITNNVSWGNIWASYNSDRAWQATITEKSGTAIPYGGWISGSVNTNPMNWTWGWDFPQEISSAHVKFNVYTAFFANSFKTSAVGGTLSNYTVTDAGDGTVWVECNITNAKGIRVTASQTYGSFCVIGAFQLLSPKAVVITGGDADAGRLVKVCDLNWNRENKQLATINKTMSESSSRAITINAKNIPFVNNGGYTGSNAFCWATDGQYDGETKIFGQQISFTSNPGGRSLTYHTIPTYLYIPKNVTNPFTAKIMNTYTAKFKN